MRTLFLTFVGCIASVVVAATAVVGCSSSSSSATGGSTHDAAAGSDDAGDAAAVVTPTWAASSKVPRGEGRWGMPLAYVSDQKRFVGFGGDTAAAVAETWSLTPADAKWTSVAATNAPAPRYCHCTTHLPDQNAVLVVGGRDDNGPLAPGAWTLDLATNAWSEITTGDIPQGVIGCMATYMPNVKKAIVFGGGGSTRLYSDTWSYDPGARAFTKLATAKSPPARMDGMATFDPGDGGRMLVFSGAVVVYPPPGVQLQDLWAFDGTDWKEIPKSGIWPKGRRVAAHGFDKARRRWIVFGGTLDPQDLADTWSLDAATGTWTQYADDGAPAARGFSSSGYDPVGDAFFVFGGLQQPRLAQLADGWTLTLR